MNNRWVYRSPLYNAPIYREPTQLVADSYNHNIVSDISRITGIPHTLFSCGYNADYGCVGCSFLVTIDGHQYPVFMKEYTNGVNSFLTGDCSYVAL